MLGDRLTQRLLQLTGRERWLLGALGAVGLPLGIAFGLVLPLLEARDRAARELVEARALLDWVAAEARRLPPEGGAAPPVTTPVGLGGLERRLVEAGLRDRITELADRGGGEVAIGFGRVPFVALAAWLEEVEREGGYSIAALRLEAAASPGEVTVRITLAPRR